MAKTGAVSSAKSEGVMAKKPDFLENYELAEPVLKQLFGSKLRISILNELAAKPMTLADLSRSVKTGAPNVSAKLKELASGGFVEREDGRYGLTGWGKSVHSDVGRSISNFSVFEKFRDFWTLKETDSVPKELWDRLWMLNNCKLVKVNERNEDAVDESIIPLIQSVEKFLYGITPFFEKTSFETFVDVCLKRDIDFKGIGTKVVFEEMLKHFPAKKLREWESRGTAKFYEVNGTNVAFMVSEKYISFGLESKDVPMLYGDMDLQGFDSNAVEWGRMYYEHLLKQAKPVRLEDYL